MVLFATPAKLGMLIDPDVALLLQFAIIQAILFVRAIFLVMSMDIWASTAALMPCDELLAKGRLSQPDMLAFRAQEKLAKLKPTSTRVSCATPVSRAP